MKQFLKQVFNPGPDPVKECQVYLDKENGSCVHVDGMLCHYETCTTRLNYNHDGQQGETQVTSIIEE